MPYRNGRYLTADQADVLDRLAHLEQTRQRTLVAIAGDVETARRLRLSWALIGAQLGITKQAAQARYDRRLPL